MFCPPIGIDTVHLLLEDAVIDLDHPDCPPFSAPSCNAVTGEVRVGTEFRTLVGGVTEFKRGVVWEKGQRDCRFQVRRAGLEVKASLARLPDERCGPNVYPVESEAELAHRLTSLEEHLRERGIQADIRRARLLRVDLFRDTLLPLPVSAFGPALEGRGIARMTPSDEFFVRGGTSYGWSNSDRGVGVYDKAIQQGLRVTGTTVRVEVRLLQARAVVRYLEATRVCDLIESDLTTAYKRQVTERLGEAEPFRSDLQLERRSDEALIADLRLRHQKPANAIGDYLAVRGIEAIQAEGADLFDTLKTAGYSARQINRQVRDLPSYVRSGEGPTHEALLACLSARAVHGTHPGLPALLTARVEA